VFRIGNNLLLTNSGGTQVTNLKLEEVPTGYTKEEETLKVCGTLQITKNFISDGISSVNLSVK